MGALVVALMFGGAQAPAQAAKACSVPEYPGSGYFTSLTVKRVECRTGRKLALAYYRCRTQDGRRGKCHRARVMRFRCHEVRQSIATELDGRVTCKRGRKKVVHSYQQNL
ncbi:MAG TPA: hypothetical protein VFM58_24300 [Solirubrobacteraceae bacterium]|nr:hypothetical protein [Solirubrobacteraceae bacterium]